MPVKKSTRSKVSAASRRSPAAAGASSKKASPSKRQFGAGTMLVAAMCVTGAVIVIAAREMTPARVAATEARPDDVTTVETVATQPNSVAMHADDTEGALPATADTTASKPSAANVAPVTIFGCLERSSDTYRLTDTDGVDAPKARSWKTGFLKKGAASVEVVDPGNRVRLANQVGHRVGVTGTLTDRHLQARSIRRISASCGN